jgi:cephalosporin-C deacetylase
VTDVAAHGYSFDPSYGYSLEELYAVQAPKPPDDFEHFWWQRYMRASRADAAPTLKRSALARQQHDVWRLAYRSADGIAVRGWLLRPRHQAVRRGLVLGHGYGGIHRPEYELAVTDAAVLIPCFRGLGVSAQASIPPRPQRHVLHGIESRETYVLGGCVDDLWTGISALLALHPETSGRIGYLGISFGGGIGALAMPWDERITRVHLNVPAFGHQPLRRKLPTAGSAAAIQRYEVFQSNTQEVLRYYDAASAAAYMYRPVHVAAARFDPVVAPPCQFAVYNALHGERRLYVLDAGHTAYRRYKQQHRELLQELRTFFSAL